MQKPATLKAMTSSQKETRVVIPTTTPGWTAETMETRIVRYADLRPCYNAFIDTRSPGSEAKENFTIIGPGVSENPAQYVHIAEPHGFNIGGARQPPGCVNSQHSHDTAEVFVVHTGTWRFDLGEQGQDAQVVLHAGDVISLPTQMFRGFTNIGTESGYLFAVLGGDDPGHVLWAPAVFDMAAHYGLVLMENGSLVDTAAGQQVPADVRKMPRTSAEQVAALRKPNKSDAEKLVWRAKSNSGVTPVIAPDGPLSGPHPFKLACLGLGASDRIDLPAPELPEVLFVQSGKLIMNWDGGTVTLDAGDTMTVPVGLIRHFTSETGCVAYGVTLRHAKIK
jgi:mannose-6-phosphate isomerase-like protein (cupin superfamily)